MDLPFLLKYSPKNIDEFKCEEKFNKMIKMLINTDLLTILLYGPSGSGKSTLIDLIIKEYYKGYEYNNEVLYINNLKEQGINYYRNNVKIFCQTKCSIKNKKKFIILDDLDLINEQSQQVFRICLDNYKKNIHFICSCSNMQKIIDTMQSRVFIIRMKQITKEINNSIMEDIIKEEDLKIENDAKEHIISVSHNSIRVLLNNLEKIKLLEMNITKDIVERITTNIRHSIFEKFIEETIIKKNLNNGIKILLDLFDKGYSVIDIYETFFSFIKTTDNINETNKYKIVKVICKYITIFYNIHEDEIELPLFVNSIIKTQK